MENRVMKYVTMAVAVLPIVLVGMHWNSEMGWFMLALVAGLIVTFINDSYEQGKKKKTRGGLE